MSFMPVILERVAPDTLKQNYVIIKDSDETYISHSQVLQFGVVLKCLPRHIGEPRVGHCPVTEINDNGNVNQWRRAELRIVISSLLKYLQVSEVAVEGQVFVVNRGEVALVRNVAVNETRKQLLQRNLPPVDIYGKGNVLAY